MYTIDDNNEIVLVRGDTLVAQLTIYQNGEEFVPEEGDVIRFAMKYKYKDPDDMVLINKVIPNNTLLLILDPEDTKDLKMKKSYYYDIELRSHDGKMVDTFIRGKLRLIEEVC